MNCRNYPKVNYYLLRIHTLHSRIPQKGIEIPYKGQGIRIDPTTHASHRCYLSLWYTKIDPSDFIRIILTWLPGFVGIWGICSAGGDFMAAVESKMDFVTMNKHSQEINSFTLLVYKEAGRLPFLTHFFQLMAFSISAVGILHFLCISS